MLLNDALMVQKWNGYTALAVLVNNYQSFDKYYKWVSSKQIQTKLIKIKFKFEFYICY